MGSESTMTAVQLLEPHARRCLRVQGARGAVQYLQSFVAKSKKNFSFSVLHGRFIVLLCLVQSQAQMLLQVELQSLVLPD